MWRKDWSLKKHFWTKKQRSSHCVRDRNKRKKATVTIWTKKETSFPSATSSTAASLRRPRRQCALRHPSVSEKGHSERPSRSDLQQANIRKVKYRAPPVLLGHRAQTNSASSGFMWVNPLFMALPRRNACEAASIWVTSFLFTRLSAAPLGFPLLLLVWRNSVIIALRLARGRPFVCALVHAPMHAGMLSYSQIPPWCKLLKIRRKVQPRPQAPDFFCCVCSVGPSD